MKKRRSKASPNAGRKQSPPSDNEDITVRLFSGMAEVNVRVAVRVRPLLPKEKLAGEQICVKLVPKTNQMILGKDRAFTFDHIISSKTAQDTVYSKCVEPLVQKCFEGYNATVFAYGQTGSGKTYTMGGGNLTNVTEVEVGIIPRAIRNMFSIIEKQPEKDITVKVSYVEIYKEEVRDLIDMETSSKDLHIREDDSGNTLIIGAAEMECASVDEVMSCLEQGSTYRHTGSTAMNEHSSRSHSIFTMFIEQHWSDNEDGAPNMSSTRKHGRKKSDDSEMILEDAGDIEHYMCAKFHFVDLAGSERAHRTGNVGDRFKESVHINSGLLALGNVISALGDTKRKVSHIPYRDSKITRLLKDSLGGNANTVMICCISPSSANLDESLNALKYANRARNIKNKPIVNRDPQSIRFEEMQSEIRALRAELQRQRTSLISGPSDAGDFQKAIQDAGQIKSLEDRALRLQTECSHYRMIAEEAYKQLVDIQDRDILSQSQNFRLRDWLELMEEIKNKVPSTLNRDAWENQTINRLETELKQCKSDLRSDEEIFAEKAKEVSTMSDKIAELEEANRELLQKLEEAEIRATQQDEELVEKQVRIDELIEELQAAKKGEPEIAVEAIDSSLEVSSGPPTTTRRAKSVPVQMLGTRSSRTAEQTRNIHTSPALFSLERAMQSFRARSALLVSRLEDNDDVLQKHFSDDEVITDDDDEDDDIIIGGGNDVAEEGPSKRKLRREPFQRGGKTRSTYKVNRPKQQKHSIDLSDGQVELETSEDIIRKSQTDDEKLSLKTTKKGKPLARGATFKAADRPDFQHIDARNNQNEKHLKQSEIQVRQSTQKVRDLNINIKMKEQLIKELIKTGKDAQAMNKQYENKIKSLEHEKQSAKLELSSIQKMMLELEQSKQQDKSEKEKLQNEFRKKIELAKMRIHSLQKKQKETEKMASLTSNTDKRISDLESAIDKMKLQQDQLQRRLKEEMEQKVKLEREMSKEQQKIKELEVRTEQQKKVLKVKTEEVSGLQRRLRSGSQSSQNRLTLTSVSLRASQLREEQTRLDEQKKWLDQEIEKVLEQRKQMETVEKELGKREDIIAKKEAMLAEKSELEIKKLRSSQVLNKDIVTVSTKLETVERMLEEKSREISSTPRDSQPKLKEDMGKLQHAREKLRKQRNVLDSKLNDGSILSPQEERRLIELDEAVDALDAAIEYKNEAIHSKQEDLRRSVLLSQSEDHFASKLRSLTAAETRTLLTRYFEKVIDLRETDRKKDLHCSEMEMKIDELDRLTRELESSLQRAGLETDRKLTHQQQEYEKKIQMLMRQLMEAESNRGSTSSGSGDERAKIEQLEKDLYYYKKTTRDLKKKLRELMAGIVSNAGDGDRGIPGENGEGATPRSAKSTTPRPGTNQSKIAAELASPRDKWDKLGSARDGLSARDPGSARDSARDPERVRVSRKDLRRMSEEEVSARLNSARSNKDDQSLPTDSLEVGKNPWT